MTRFARTKKSWPAKALYAIAPAVVVVLVATCGKFNRPESGVILVSIDGYRWDYSTIAHTPALDEIATTGVQAEALRPVFPTNSFPNHYTIVTGLYPEQHGIVGNRMYDPVLDRYFSPDDSVEIGRSYWWDGEPVWVTAIKQGRRAASMFWPGSAAPIHNIRPNYWQIYDSQLTSRQRVQQVLAWLDQTPANRPDIVTLYFDIVDNYGHHFGPDSIQIIDAIQEVDSAIGLLMQGLKDLQLSDKYNLIVLSDHGITNIDSSRTIFLDDFVDLDEAGIIDWSPVLALRPALNKTDEIYAALRSAHPNLHVYRRGEIPIELHYSNHHRIPPIIGIADEGWSISTRQYLADYPDALNGGDHGYRPDVQSMSGIFLATGPNFKAGITVPAFSNIHVYTLITHIMGLKSAPNSGDLSVVRNLLR